jgi:hypothetical protein
MKTNNATMYFSSFTGNYLSKGNFLSFKKNGTRTAGHFLLLRIVLASFILIASNFLQAQTGYIYVHLKSINEENSTDFSFKLTNSGGTTVNSFSLNDQATSDNVALSGNNLFVYDMGLSHGTGGDGQLWVVAGTSYGSLNTTTTLTGTVYYRNAGSSQWQQPATAITNAKYIDGAYANQFVYINSTNDVIFYNNGTSTTIDNTGDAWDVTANSGSIAISTATAIKIYSKTYTAAGGVAAGGTWTTLVTPNYKSRLDMNLGAGTIVYQAINSNTVKTITTGLIPLGTTLPVVGIGNAGNTDVAYDDNGVIYTNANNTTYTDLIYHYTAGAWTAETQSRTLSTLTGGAGSLVYTVNMANGGAIESIFSRQTDNLGNIYWIDDERLKKTAALNGNGIIIPVTAGTYTLTQTLPNATYQLGRYNLYDPGGSSTGNVSAQTVTYVVTAGEVVFAEYVDEKLNPYTVNLTICNTTYDLQTFDASNSTPIYVTPTFGAATTGVVTYGTNYSGTAYHYYNASSPEDGYYYLVNIENGTDWFVNTANLVDHTGNNGFFLLVNASYSADEFYRQRLTNLTIGATYEITYYAANVNPPPALIYPNIKAGIQDLTGVVLSSASTGDITATTWTQYTLTFTATTATLDLFLTNNNPGGYGNDLAIDDIAIQLVQVDPPAATGIEPCSGTGTITVSSPTGSLYEYSDNGGTSYQAGTTFTGLSAGTYNITANYTGLTGCGSTSTPVVIIPASSIYGLDSSGLVYGLTTTGTVSTAYNNTNKPGTASTTADAVGYNASTGLFYYFLKNTSAFTFNSYNPSLTTASAYTTLASPGGGTNPVYMGGTTADGNGYYAIDNQGYLYYYNISLNTWTTISTKIEDNQLPVNNLTTQINGGEYYGDLTEDAYGNLWFLMSSATKYGLYEILAPVPTTASGTLTADQFIKYNTANPATGNWSGIAFDALGNLYMTTSSQLWYIPIGSTTPQKITPYTGRMTDLAQCTFTTNPLAIVWSSFTAALINRDVNLDWGIAQASSARGFYVERSNDLGNWDTLAFVPFSSSNANYTYMDASPAPGNNYYRIAELNNDNATNYSETRVVNVATLSSISIWPNPAIDLVHVQYSGSQNNLTALITDAMGRNLSRSVIHPGINTISLGNIPSGVYFIQLQGAGGAVITREIIKEAR